MIRGTTAQFKVTTPYDFDNLCIIETKFSQPYNNGTSEVEMPITKIYSRKFIEQDEWNQNTADKNSVYFCGKKYYQYNSAEEKWEASNELKITPLAIQAFDSEGMDISKQYQCDESYYQYNPETEEWDNSAAIDIEPVEIDTWSPDAADKKRVYVCNKKYYTYNTETQQWESSEHLLPVEEVEYWDNAEKDTSKIYFCEAVYYKYDPAAKEWQTYDHDCNRSVFLERRYERI